MTTATTETIADKPWLGTDTLALIADLPNTMPWPVAERILQTREIGRRATFWSRWHYDPIECSVCGTVTAAGTQIHYTPGVCTCSEANRPSMADPCREENDAMICDECSNAARRVPAAAQTSQAYRQGDRVEVTTSNGDRYTGGRIAGFIVEFEDGRLKRMPWDSTELRPECHDSDCGHHDLGAVHIDH